VLLFRKTAHTPTLAGACFSGRTLGLGRSCWVSRVDGFKIEVAARALGFNAQPPVATGACEDRLAAFGATKFRDQQPILNKDSETSEGHKNAGWFQPRGEQHDKHDAEDEAQTRKV